MSEDMNMIRFEMLIDEIGNKLHFDWGAEEENDHKYSLLDYFFDSQKMNSYAKMIYDKARNYICYFPESENEAVSLNSQIELFSPAFIRNSRIELFSPVDIKNNIRSKIRAMKTFCKCYDFYKNYEKLYALMFWSFMILTVDDNQKEEALAKISDFLTLLGEREDMKSYFDPKNTPLYIINVIKYLYHYDGYEDTFDGTSTALRVSRLFNKDTDRKIETYFAEKGVTKGVIKKRGDTSATSDTWTCPRCGKIMPKYVGTCGCGEPQPFSF